MREEILYLTCINHFQQRRALERIYGNFEQWLAEKKYFYGYKSTPGGFSLGRWALNTEDGCYYRPIARRALQRVYNISWSDYGLSWQEPLTF